MPEVLKLSLGQDNYPKARALQASQVQRSKPVTAHSATSVRTSTQQNVPGESFQTGHYDSNVADMNELQRRAKARNLAAAPAKSGRISVDPGYPLSGAKASQAPAPGRAATPARTGQIALDPGYPQAGAQPRQGNSHAAHQSNSLAPHQSAARSTSTTHPAPRASKAPTPRYDYSKELATIEAQKKKNAASLAAQHRAKAQAAKAPASKAPANKAPGKAPIAKAPQIRKPSKSGGAKMAGGGAVKVLSGGLTVRNGVKNLANGNYTEGGLQVAQGGVSVADGVNDINTARRGLSGAPAGKFAPRVKVAGGVLNAGMAAYDTKQAYDAYKSGNEVLAADKTSSAVINAISAFPPTAIVGAVGGVADWAMAASGADDAMIRALNSKQDKAYQAQTKKDMSMAKTLAKLPTAKLAKFSRAQRQEYIRGMEGLKQYRQQFAAQGDTRGVESVDYQVARIRSAWK